ncbi:hypothetical protein WN48_03860 [Eufriesea mexicana]|uniref:Uncharacterized protein n=1 Tax=Eufriesea mexicana TaxID=516756 RepID=A0A310SAN7_9HYME|nr:hypothetical protein WN48_03860 [Eufriesea mexicana]
MTQFSIGSGTDGQTYVGTDWLKGLSQNIDALNRNIQQNVHQLNQRIQETVHGNLAQVYRLTENLNAEAGVRRGNTYYAESRNKKGAAYVSTEKNAWQGHINIRINEEMENEYLVIVMKGNDKSDIESECC